MSRIIIKQGPYRPTEKNFPDAFIKELDGEGQDRGTLEAMQKTIENNSAAIGRLVEILYDKHMVSMDEVKKIIGLDWEIHFEIRKD
jgi:hypothetical protein